MSAPTAVEIRLGDAVVGLLERLEDFEYVFAFDQRWLQRPDRPVLGQLFEDKRPVDIRTSGFPCWFAHLLPQGPFRRAILRSLNSDDDENWALFLHTGSDLPGAVVAVPAMRRLARSSEPVRPGVVAQGLLRFALAGVQWKLSLRDGERGLTVPMEGSEARWIAKFPAPDFPGLPRIECATMQWARSAGINVPYFRPARIEELVEVPQGLPLDDGRLFLIERFDRARDGTRIHIEDFAQVLDRPNHYVGRYEEIAGVLSKLCPEDLRELIRRIVFCVLAGNTDAHLKNWSLIYPDQRHARLSPAYDLVASVVYVPRIEDRLALALHGSTEFESLGVGSFDVLAAVADLDAAEVTRWVREDAARILSSWRDTCRDLDFTDAERALLETHFSRIPLARSGAV